MSHRQKIIIEYKSVYKKMMHVLVCEDVYKNGEHFCDFHQHSEKWKLPPTEMNIIVCLYNLPSFGTRYIFIIHAYNHTNKKKQN